MTSTREILRQRPAAGYGAMSESQKLELFQAFKTHYGRSYGQEEESRRYAIFKESLGEIDALVAEKGEMRWAITRWTDHTLEEMLEFGGHRSKGGDGKDKTDVDWSSMKSESYQGMWAGNEGIKGRLWAGWCLEWGEERIKAGFLLEAFEGKNWFPSSQVS